MCLQNIQTPYTHKHDREAQEESGHALTDHCPSSIHKAQAQALCKAKHRKAKQTIRL